VPAFGSSHQRSHTALDASPRNTEVRTTPIPRSLKPAQIVLIPTLVGLNLVVAWIAQSIKLPIFLDSIGITLAAILAGPVVAVIVGVATCLLGSLVLLPSYWAFSGTAAAIALMSALFARYRFYVKWWTAIIAGLAIAVVSATVSAPVAAYLTGGATGGGIDAVTLLFRAAGNTVVKSVFLSGFSSEPVDKVITALAAWFLAHSLSRRTMAWFPGAESRIRGTPAS
jgi:energy-coupling factor transport system substrate-specific component